MKYSHKDAAKWDTFGWGNVEKFKISGDGALGVMFIWTDSPYEMNNVAFIVKPIQGTALPTRFAEHVVGKVAQAEMADSIECLNGTPAGQLSESCF